MHNCKGDFLRLCDWLSHNGEKKGFYGVDQQLEQLDLRSVESTSDKDQEVVFPFMLQWLAKNYLPDLDACK